MNDDQLLRYSRHILLDDVGIEGQQRLVDSHVLVVGAGGLGSPVAMYLAASGVGHITIADHDVVDLTNLQRQIAHTTARVGHPKVESAAHAMLALNPEVRVTALANSLFGQMPQGYRRVEAIQKWVQSQVTFQSNTSNSMTSALDTLNDHKGVCRDFAHLMITMCRALNIPARFTTAIDFGADPALGPTDFHAYVEVYLGHRWYLFDPSGTAIPMGFVRIGTGRDAADASFATIFGGVQAQAPVIDISAQVSPQNGWQMPVHRTEALSTDSGWHTGF